MHLPLSLAKQPVTGRTTGVKSTGRDERGAVDGRLLCRGGAGFQDNAHVIERTDQPSNQCNSGCFHNLTVDGQRLWFLGHAFSRCPCTSVPRHREMVAHVRRFFFRVFFRAIGSSAIAVADLSDVAGNAARGS